MNEMQCGVCTACCTTHAVEEIGKGVYEPCTNLCKAGCAIYKDRPTACRNFKCAWLAGKLGRSKVLRPDRCGIVVTVQADEELGDLVRVMEVWDNASQKGEGGRYFRQLCLDAQNRVIRPVVLQQRCRQLVAGPPEFLAQVGGS